MGGGWWLSVQTAVHAVLFFLLALLILNRMKGSPCAPWALAWTLWNFITLAFAPHASSGLRSVWVITDGLLAFIIATNVREDAMALRWPLVFCGVTLPAVATGVGWEFHDMGWKIWSSPKIFSSFFPNPNLLAGYLLLILPIPWALFLESRDAQERKISLGLAGLGWLLLMSSGSRSALIIGVAMLWLLHRSSSPKKSPFSQRALLIAGGLLSGAVLFSSKHWESILDRWLWWKTAWQIFLDHPLKGIGVGQFNVVSPMYARIGTLHSLFPHSFPLQILSETGIIGLFLFAGVMATALRWMRSTPRTPLQKGLTFGIFGTLLQNTVDYNLTGPANWLLFSWMAGLACPAQEPQVQSPQGHWRKSFLLCLILLGIDLSSRPWRSDRAVQEGRVNLSHENYEKTLNNLRVARRLDPTSLDALRLSFRLQTNLSRKVGSASYLEQAEAELLDWQKIPSTGSLWIELAMAWGSAGRLGSAAHCFQQAVEVNPLLRDQAMLLEARLLEQSRSIPTPR